MGLFSHRHARLNPDPPTVAGLGEVLGPRGWQPVTGRPFDGHLEDRIHDLSRAMYHVPVGMNTAQVGIRVGGTVFTDAFRNRVGQHDVVVANAHTEVETELRYAKVEWHAAAVCAVELPIVQGLLTIESRQHHPGTRSVPTGDPAFDACFVANAASPELLTADVRARMLARDDWSFIFERYWLGCVTIGSFGTPAEVLERIDAVMAVVAAFPAVVIPAGVDHSTDDLAARIEALSSMDEAMAFLQALTPDGRSRLAASDSPLAAFADVRTPQEALARMHALPPAQKMQLMGLLMRVRDEHRR